MSLLHPALLFGLALTAIPVLLHLLLRAWPKRLLFPALRLIQQNRRQNVRRMQLRHLWLLLLRIGVIALIVLALTRPSLPAANYSLIGREWLTLLLIMVAGVGCYFAILSSWQRLHWPRHQFLTRRTMLRGSTGSAILLLMLLAVGWPYVRRVSAEMKDPTPKSAENIPVAAVFLFDTSPSMGYRQGNQTRLQAAQQIGRDHLSRLPAGSKVAVATTDESSSGAAKLAAQTVDEHFPAFSLDLQAARARIDTCEIKAGGQSLNERIRTALLAQEEDRRRISDEQSSIPETQRQDRYVREIYVFTDLARSAWREDVSSLLKEELTRLKMFSVYLIDVGEVAPTNVGMTSIKPVRDTVPQGAPVKIDVGLSSIGNVKREQTVEFLLNEGGKLVKRDQRTIAVEAGVESRLTFEIPAMTGRFQQGEFRIAGSDPLSADDVGYFTVQALPSLRLLLVADVPATAFFWQSALEYVSSANITKFDTEFLSASQFADSDLKRFDIVYLINPSIADDAVWVRLHDYVESGGGLGVFLGSNSSVSSSKARNNLINPVACNSKAAQNVLPAELVASLSDSKPQSMDMRNSQHPFLKRLEDSGVITDLGGTDVYRYWKVTPQESSLVIAKFDGPQRFPAILERRIGRGRVFMMTTSVNDPEWNDLVGSALSFAFADQLSQYLSQQGTLRCNLQVGEEVALAHDRERKLKKVVLRMPDFKQRTLEIPADSKNFLLRDLTAVGSYQVDSSDAGTDYHTGFSLNLAPVECDLRRLATADLDALLGEGRYTVNRDTTALERNVQTGRMGQEMYSFAVGFLVIVFSLEQFTATWFYRTDEA